MKVPAGQSRDRSPAGGTAADNGRGEAGGQGSGRATRGTGPRTTYARTEVTPTRSAKWIAVAIIAFVPLSLVAQSESPDIFPPTVRQHVSDGRHEEAWQTLHTLPVSATVLRARIELGLLMGRADRALESLDALEASTAERHLAVLTRISILVLQNLLSSTDRDIQSASCVALPSEMTHDCQPTVLKIVNDARLPDTLRLAAASRLARAGDATALAHVKRLAAHMSDRDLLGLGETLHSLPPDLEAQIWIPRLESSLPEVRYLAASKLGHAGGAEALAALKLFVEARESDVAIFPAQLSLARLGHAPARSRIKEIFPLLGGGDLLSAADVLLETDESLAVNAFRRVADGDHLMLRLEAAVRLRSYDAELGSSIVDQALESDNMWVRVRSLEAARRLGSGPSGSARRLLLDPNEWVRLRAAELVLSASDDSRQGRS